MPPASPGIPPAVPRITDDVVERPRITRLLHGLLGRPAPVQVVAAAGAGKTTAVAQAVEALGRPVAWVTLEEWHRSPGRLVDELAAALEHYVPGLQDEAARARALNATPAELARLVGQAAHMRDAVFVVDDCHVIREAPEAVAVLASLARGAHALDVVLVGRVPLALPGLGVDALDPDAMVDDAALRATEGEAADILALRAGAVDVQAALDGTGGWVAGLVFESWRLRGDASPTADRLALYVESEVVPRLGQETREALVASSLLGALDVGRADAFGVRDPRAWLAELRRAGVPAVWAPDGSGMRLHPRVREVLLDTLRSGPRARLREAERTAATCLEREGELERALEHYLAAGDAAAVSRLVPRVIVGVVARGDLNEAERYLASVAPDPEPSEVVLARLILASIQADGPEACRISHDVVTSGRLEEMLAGSPMIGAFAVHFLAGEGRLADALAVYDAMPPGRAAEVARLALSLARDDDEIVPSPPFTGDPLDASVARLLYCKGRLGELRAGQSDWALVTAATELSAPGSSPHGSLPSSDFAGAMARLATAIDKRDLELGEASLAQLDLLSRGVWHALCEAELAVRVVRDPTRALAAVSRLRAREVARLPFYGELSDTWAGGAQLLQGDAAAAAATLRATVARMRHGDRTLCLPTALVYLAEAEWRIGNEDASDRATDEAYEVAHRSGNLRALLLSFADVPGVLSRRIDTEPAGESVWHWLGRAVTDPSAGVARASVVPTIVHVREFGEPAVVVEGHEAVRPKIRKSIELFSFLLSTRGGRATRSAVIQALWNGRDDDSTRAYLRQALRHLRAVLPDGTDIESDRDMLAVVGPATSEQLELEALVSEVARTPPTERHGVLSQVLDLVGRGEFLPGSDGVDWVDDRRTWIESVAVDARLDLAELLVAHERHVEALALLERVLDAERMSERAYRLSMQAHGMLGDEDGVLSAYCACRDALAEIGLEPSRATVELARNLRR